MYNVHNVHIDLLNTILTILFQVLWTQSTPTKSFLQDNSVICEVHLGEEWLQFIASPSVDALKEYQKKLFAMI